MAEIPTLPSGLHLKQRTHSKHAIIVGGNTFLDVTIVQQLEECATTVASYTILPKLVNKLTANTGEVKIIPKITLTVTTTREAPTTFSGHINNKLPPHQEDILLIRSPLNKAHQIPSSDAYVFAMTNMTTDQMPTAEITVNGVCINIIVDTGASVNIIDQTTYTATGQPLMTQHDIKLFTYGRKEQIPVAGRFETTAERGNTIHHAIFYVVCNMQSGNLYSPIQQPENSWNYR